MIRKLLIFLALGLLVGCGPTPVVREGIVVKGPQRSPTPLPTAIRTLVPASTAAQTAAANPAAYPAQTAYPALPSAAPQGAIPSPAAAATTAPAPTTQPAATFHDCARTPGLVSCDPSAPAIPARLAFYDASAGRLVALDLQSGAGWQSPLPVTSLDWSPKGDLLLAAAAQDQYSLFAADGALREAFASPHGARWQADNTLVRGQPPAVIAADGRAAWLEQTADMTYLLHVRAADGSQPPPVAVTTQPSDKLYALRGWVPGTDTLLAQSYSASNAAMLAGGALLTIDSRTGAQKDLGVTAPLSSSPDLAWDPQQPGLLALVVSEGAGGPPNRRLALIDFPSGSLRYPLPEGPQIGDLAWQPGAQRLAFSVTSVAGLPPDVAKTFPAAGIYRLDPRSGAVDLLTQPPASALDGWPHWFSDGKILVFARRVTDASGQARVEVRARQVADGQEWLLVQGLPGDGAQPAFGQIHWSGMLALAGK